MKSKILLIPVLVITLATMVFVSACSKDNNSSDVPASVAPILPGNWMIHYYFNITEQSNKYLAYTFTFNSNGTLVATKTGASYNGTWKEEVDSGKRKLTLDFDASVTESALLELEEDWIVVSSSSTLINLEDKAVQVQFMKM
jgi:hypothetical protein